MNSSATEADQREFLLIEAFRGLQRSWLCIPTFGPFLQGVQAYFDSPTPGLTYFLS